MSRPIRSSCPGASGPRCCSATGKASPPRLHLVFAGLRQSFTTHNTHVPDESVQLDLVDGPFSALRGMWRFIPIAMPSRFDVAEGGGACRTEFELDYGFANGVLGAAISPVFDRIADTFVDSFVRRAEQVHGER